MHVEQIPIHRRVTHDLPLPCIFLDVEHDADIQFHVDESVAADMESGRLESRQRRGRLAD